ncbi:hypothetical protein [Streptomyces sp. S.PNR 29]|uniref:hypothetical protein n=1 Tax=Streptomyces sp. S.PNR 29 TaxID=2973805 RepID=UPI0025B0E8AD|nr:hypothetical protein [Streptomyces sp. S.PNR 29]MDN0193826.1 hypothetical protein [Streptomyces sp. S.PNR 29]
MTTTYVLCGPAALKRRGVPLLAEADGRQGNLSRPAAPWGRGFPGSAPTSRRAPEARVTPHRTPVPNTAHPTARAIRVLRSPR